MNKLICVFSIILLIIPFCSMKPTFAGELVTWGWDVGGLDNVPDGNNFVAVAPGYNHSLALRSDGSLVAWGRNSYGVLDVPENSNFIAISSNNWHSLALKSDGSLIAWGWNDYGQTNVPYGNDFVAIDSGKAYNLALKSDGSLVAWGYNAHGQCNVPPGNDFIDIAAGGLHGVALRSDGSLIAWGNSTFGRCNVPLGNDFVDIAAGLAHNVALKSDGSLVAWGYNADGQCNVPPSNDFVKIACGWHHSTALEADGTIIAWGGNDYGQCDIPTGGPFAEIACGWNHNLAIVAEPAMPSKQVSVDIKPRACPNPVNVKSSGVLPVAILGTVDYDVTTIDPTSIRLTGVEPLRSGYEDVAAPVSDNNDCNCITEGPDGFLDLTLKFETQKIVEAIGDVNDGDVLTLELTGVLFGERPIEGADCILIRGRHKPINPADINKDGVVNAADFAIFAQNWLQSSIVDE